MTTVQYAKAYPAMRTNAVAPVFTKTALNAGIGRQSVDRGARIIARMTQNRLPARQTRRPGPLLTVPVPGRITWIAPGRNGADMSALTTRPRVMAAAKA